MSQFPIILVAVGETRSALEAIDATVHETWSPIIGAVMQFISLGS